MPNLMLVDDMAIFREPIAAALTKHGYKVQTAADGRSAINLIRENAPDLLLLDITMPELDGLSVLRVIRKLEATKSLPVIMLTDANDKSDIKQAALLGISSYMLKSSFSLETLLERIEHGLRGDVASDGGETENDKGSEAEASTPSPQSENSSAGSHAKGSLKDYKPLMTRSEVQEAIDGSGELKGLSPAVSEVLSLTQRKDCTMETVARAIRRDPGISLKLLRLANSSVYDRGEPADTIDKAVMRMGLTAVRQAVMNLNVVEKFSDSANDDPRLSAPQFWEHSIATGLIAAEITRSLHDEDDTGVDEAADSAFTMGLLHDAGRMVYAEMFGSRYIEVLDAADRLGLPLEQVESRILLINHAEAMDRILHAWSFPKHLINPIAFHHLPVAEGRKLSKETATESTVLALANGLAHALLLGHSGNRAVYSLAEYIDALRLDSAVISRIEQMIPEQTSDMKFAMLSRSPGDGWPEYATLVQKQLPDGFCPLFVGTDPQNDAIRIMCDQLCENDDDSTPTVAIVHLPQGRDVARLSQTLVEAEKAAGVEGIPTITVSPKGNLQLEEDVLANRPDANLSLPFTVSDFVSAIDELMIENRQAA